MTEREEIMCREIARLKLALLDIAGAEAIPNDKQAFEWCKMVASEALERMEREG